MKKVESELTGNVQTNKVPKTNKEDELQSDKGKGIFLKRLFSVAYGKKLFGNTRIS